jgi:hypothetical protein
MTLDKIGDAIAREVLNRHSLTVSNHVEKVADQEND